MVIKRESIVVVKYVVYLLYSLESHIYIGITKQPDIRKWRHSHNSHNPDIKRLIQIGIPFHFEVLQENLTENEALRIELDTIEMYEKEYGSKVLNKSKRNLISGSHLIDKEKHKRTLLTLSSVDAIRRDWIKSEGTLHQTQLAIEYGVSLATIHNIIHNKRWYDPLYVPHQTSSKLKG